MRITKKLAEYLFELSTRLKNIHRWSSLLNSDCYNEAAKQLLNVYITFFLALECENEGMELNWKLFPKIAISHAVKKAIVCDLRKTHLEEMCLLGGLSTSIFDSMKEQEIQKYSEEGLPEWLEVPNSCIERKIFHAGIAISTFMEIAEMENTVESILVAEYCEKIEETRKEVHQFEDIPGVARMSNLHSAEMKCFHYASRLRNRMRWERRECNTRASDLSHMFEVAIISYFLALEKVGDEEIATKCFFIGAFHDFPETFTGDMPSPVKDAAQGMRAATELFENEMMEKYVYSILDSHLANGLKSVMLEEEQAKYLKPLIKDADYLSAVWECTRELQAGNKDNDFIRILKGYEKTLSPKLPESFQIYFEIAMKYCNELEATELLGKVFDRCKKKGMTEEDVVEALCNLLTK